VYCGQTKDQARNQPNGERFTFVGDREDEAAVPVSCCGRTVLSWDPSSSLRWRVCISSDALSRQKEDVQDSLI
jgi:hypothetical protein